MADAELSAVEDGLTAYEKLLAKLADVPTPAGPTPRQLGREHLVQLQVVNSQHDPTISRSFATFGGKLRSSDHFSGNADLPGVSGVFDLSVI